MTIQQVLYLLSADLDTNNRHLVNEGIWCSNQLHQTYSACTAVSVIESDISKSDELAKRHFVRDL